jgi:hypothetical protein
VSTALEQVEGIRARRAERASRTLRGDIGEVDPVEQALLRRLQAEDDERLIAEHEQAEVEREARLQAERAEAGPRLEAATTAYLVARDKAHAAVGVALAETAELRAARFEYTSAWSEAETLGLDVPERIPPVQWADAAHRISDDLANA